MQTSPMEDSNDDVSAEYEARVEAAMTEAARARLMEIAGSAEQPAPAETAEQPAEAPTPEGESTIASVVSDVAEGVIETPLQIVGGAVDAVNEVSDLAHEAASWLNENVADLGTIRIGAEGISWVSGVPADNELKAPTTDKADSATGGVVRALAQFAVGFKGAGKVLGKSEKFQAAGKTAQITAKGALAEFAAFDPHEARLSNLVQEYPALANPITEFMSAQPDDSAAVGRMKAAVEGLLAGHAAQKLVDTTVAGIRALRDVRAAKTKLAETESAAVPMDRAKAAAEEAPKPDLSIIGDPDTDALVLRKTRHAMGKTEDISPDDITKAAPDEADLSVSINWANINTADDVKNVMQNFAEITAADLHNAKRKTRSLTATAEAAERLDAWDVLIKRRKGDALNAEQITAVRNLWTSAGEKLTEVAYAAKTNPSTANLYALRKMEAVYHLIQREAVGATAEAGRALGALRISAKSNAMRMQQMKSMLDGMGGEGVAKEIASSIANLVESGNYAGLEKFMMKSTWARTTAAVKQTYIMGLLSAPPTHIANALGGLSMGLMNAVERQVGRGISRSLGTKGGVEQGEAVALLAGQIEGMKDALRISAKGARALAQSAKFAAEGAPGPAADVLRQSADEFGTVFKSAATGKTGYGVDKIEDGRVGALSAEAWNVAENSTVGRALNLIDAATTAPGRVLGSTDEFFKTVAYRAEVHAQARRQAVQELRAGRIPPDALPARIAELIENPPEHIKLEGVKSAAYATFTNTEDNVARRFAKGVSDVPILGTLLMPFKNTPPNIFLAGLERTPLAPLVGNWKADIAAGGARRDLALARMATGSTMIAVAMDMAMIGNVTGSGPSDPQERENLVRQGWQPYSVKVGDKWVAYNRLEPVGTTFSLGADLVDAYRNATADEADLELAARSAMLAVANATISKTYMSGMASFIEAVSDPQRYGQSWAAKIAGSMVPSGVAAIARAEDPSMRAASDMVDGVLRRSPWHNQDLPKVYDIWGRERKYSSPMGGAWDFLSPIRVSEDKAEPIDNELERLGYFPSSADKQLNVDGVTIDLRDHPHAYARYTQLAGNELKDPAFNMGTKDYLNALITGKHPLSVVYQSPHTTDDARIAMIRRHIEGQREAAKFRIIEEFPELKASLDVQKEAQRGAIGGNLRLK